MKSAYDLLRERFGVNVRAVEFPAASDADIAAQVIARRDGGRVALVIINLSANTVVVAPFAGVTTTRGIQIPANGGFLSMNVQDDYLLPTMEWSAVASADNSAIYVLAIEIEPAAPEAA